MHDPARRTVIAGTAGAVAVLTAATATPALAAQKPTDLLRRSRFAGQVGATFTMASAAGRRSVLLRAVADLGPGAPAGSEGQFSAAFEGAGLTDGTYAFSRKGFASTTLFVVADPSGQRGLATVNRP